MKRKKRFVCYFYFQGSRYVSLGFHLDLGTPNIELHIPFGFIRIGLSSWEIEYTTKWVCGVLLERFTVGLTESPVKHSYRGKVGPTGHIGGYTGQNLGYTGRSGPCPEPRVTVTRRGPS
jgi:hypothetical protein